MADIFLVPGLRTPFVKAGTHYAQTFGAGAFDSAGERDERESARPDFLVWGQVIPDPTLSNIARELVLRGRSSIRTIPAFSTVMACSTSFIGMAEAAGMLGRGNLHLALVGGVETMSHIPLALKAETADRIIGAFLKNPGAAAEMLPMSRLPISICRSMAGPTGNRGRSMGEHTEDTAKFFGIARADQDRRALQSHQGAIAGQDAGFFKDLVLPFGGVDHDTIPRRDTSFEKLSALPPVFDRTSGKGTLTAGNSSPNTDGAASIWVADSEGLKRLGDPPRRQAGGLGNGGDGLSRGRHSDGAGAHHPAPAGAPQAQGRRHRAVGNPRGVRGAGAGQRQSRLRSRLSAREGGRRFRSRPVSVGARQPQRRLAGARPSLCRHRRAHPEPGREGTCRHALADRVLSFPSVRMAARAPPHCWKGRDMAEEKIQEGFDVFVHDGEQGGRRRAAILPNASW